MTARLSGICSAVCGRCNVRNEFFALAIMRFRSDADCVSGCDWVDEAPQYVEMDNRVLGASDN